MDLSTALLLAASGLAAGLVNAIAGGGTFFTFSALVAAGLPPVVANATSAVAVTPANLSSAWAYRRELSANLRRLAALGAVSLVGGLLGAYILTVTDNSAFRRLVPWLLLFATVLFAASPRIVALARAIGRYEGHHPSTRAWASGLAFQGLVAIYGGFFGAGMGIVVLFVVAGLVSWPDAAVVGAASVAGGYLGVAFARRLSAGAIRWLVIAVGAALTVYFFVR